MPPIPRGNEVSQYRSPRREAVIPGSERINTRAVANVQVSILTKDLATVKISPQSAHHCNVTSYPDGLPHVYPTDIKELQIKIENKDGSVTNVVAVPKLP